MNEVGDTPDYPHLPLVRLLELVASEDPVPAGGSVAALAVAFAAGLSAMAARLSPDYRFDAAKLAERADSLRDEVLPLARADAAAYGRVLSARRAREESVDQALSEAADVALTIAEVGAEVADIAARVAQDGNPNLKGDATAGALLAEAGVRAAARLAEIDLSSAGIEDGRLARAHELIEAAASARQAAEGEGRHVYKRPP